MPRIYLSPPHVGQAERELLLDAFDSNWIAPLGPHVDAFEKELATLSRVKAAAALSSGTAGLHIALMLSGVEAGDTVFCSSFTFAATANPIRYCGATPVFIDSDAATWNMSPGLLEEALRAAAAANRLPKAVIVVDLYGQCADYEPILAICERYGVTVIEDAAEALGATYRGRPAGGFGAMGVLSFNGNKIITTSGGGMLLSNDETLIERARFLSTQARDTAPHYQHSTIGYNYRMSNLLAAVGRGQLRSLSDRVATRRGIFARYQEAFADAPGIGFMPEAPYGTSNRWLSCITVDPEEFGTDRETIRLALAGADIEARPLWKPMHLQPVFAECRMYGGSVSAGLFERGLCLPSGSSLSRGEQDEVIEIVARCGHAAARR
jgi:dTDP-4-amino-4,6-dideoxygalactose transaminase